MAVFGELLTRFLEGGDSGSLTSTLDGSGSFPSLSIPPITVQSTPISGSDPTSSRFPSSASTIAAIAVTAPQTESDRNAVTIVTANEMRTATFENTRATSSEAITVNAISVESSITLTSLPANATVNSQMLVMSLTVFSS